LCKGTNDCQEEATLCSGGVDFLGDREEFSLVFAKGVINENEEVFGGAREAVEFVDNDSLVSGLVDVLHEFLKTRAICVFARESSVLNDAFEVKVMETTIKLDFRPLVLQGEAFLSLFQCGASNVA
jgi:hypothetical protein